MIKIAVISAAIINIYPQLSVSTAIKITVTNISMIAAQENMS